MSYSLEIRERAVELKKSWSKVQEIAEKLFTEFQQTVAPRTIFYWTKDILEEVGKQRKDNQDFIKDLNDSVWEKQYEVEDDSYIFYKKVQTKEGPVTKKFKIPISLADDLFYHYSRHGKWWTQQQIIDNFQITSEAWMLIKNRLGLNTFSNVFSPEGMEREAEKGDEYVTQKIMDVTHKAIEDKYKQKLIATYDKQYKKIATQAMRKSMNQDYLLERIEEALQWYRPLTLDFPRPVPNNKEEKVVAFGDMHIGRTTEHVERRMWEMLEDLIASPEGTIVLINLWDNWENVMMGSQLMHDGQQLEMDLIWSEQVFKSVEIIENFIVSLYKAGKVVKYHGVVHSNHDRVTKNDESDPQHILSLLFNHLLKVSLNGVVQEFNYHKERVFNFQEAGMNFVVSHGDMWFDKKRTEQILMMYWAYWIHNICLSGHLHQAKLEEWTGYTRISVPSMNSGNLYSKEQIISEASPGYVEILPNRWWSADVLVRRLK